MTIVDQILLLILFVFCVVASIKDVKTTKIPNWIPVSLFIVWLASIFVKWILISAQVLNLLVIEMLWTCGKQVLTSAVVCCLLAACIVLSNKLRKRKGKPKTSPFGMGDIKLLMVVCLYLGPTLSFICIFVACIVFLIFVFIVNIIKKTKITKFPFAPFILAGVCTSSVIAIL